MKKTLTALTLILALTLSAQQPYIETFEVRLHNLDVVVTDAKGKTIRGLTKEDFIVTENGTTQTVTNFAVYDVAASTASGNTASATTEAQVEAVPVPPPPRRFIFFIDDLAVQKAARDRLFKNAKEMLASLREGDFVSVVRPAGQQKIAQEFTFDHAAAERALQKAIEESAEESTQRNAIHLLEVSMKNARNGLDRQVARRQYAFTERRRVEHRLGQLRALVSSLADIEGRKVIIVVTQGLGVRPGSEAWDLEAEMNLPAGIDRPEVVDAEGNVDFEAAEDVQDVDNGQMPRKLITNFTADINEIGRLAAANGATIYAIEPDVNMVSGRYGRADLMIERSGIARPPGPKAPAMANSQFNKADLPPGFESDLLQNNGLTLTTLAEKTGGKWYRGIGTIDDTFRTITQDLGFYYSLAYRATGERAGARRVEVKVRNHPEYRVRTRSEVIEKTTDRDMSDLVVASLIYPRSSNELGVNVTVGATSRERGYVRVPLDVVIPLSKLTFLPDGDKYAAAFDVHFAAAGKERDFISGGKQQQRIVLTAQQHEAREAILYHYKTGIMISPGPARIAIGVIDPTTKLTGFQTVEVK